MDEDKKELAPEGMMFVGDKGKILAGFNIQNPHLIPEKRMQSYSVPELPQEQLKPGQISPALRQWMAACRGGQPSPAAFQNTGPISEAVNLYAVALRTGRRLLYDAATMKITNSPEANTYLSRQYRKGWDPADS
jgi:hypothetical protein